MNAPAAEVAFPDVTASDPTTATGYNFAYLDEQTKRTIRRSDTQGRRRPRLPSAVRQPRDAAALRLGHRGHPVHRRGEIGPDGRVEGHRPGVRRHDKRRLHSFVLRPHHRGENDRPDRCCDDHPDPPPHPRDGIARGTGPRVPGANTRTAPVPRTAGSRPPDGCTPPATTHSCTCVCTKTSPNRVE